MSFDETTNVVPFVSDAAAPGNQIGALTFTFAPSTPSGTTFPLTLDATLTQLSNEGGTTTETVGNGMLTLVAGAVTEIYNAIPTLGGWGLILVALSLVAVALRRI